MQGFARAELSYRIYALWKRRSRGFLRGAESNLAHTCLACPSIRVRHRVLVLSRFPDASPSLRHFAQPSPNSCCNSLTQACLLRLARAFGLLIAGSPVQCILRSASFLLPSPGGTCTLLYRYPHALVIIYSAAISVS